MTAGKTPDMTRIRSDREIDLRDADLQIRREEGYGGKVNEAADAREPSREGGEAEDALLLPR
jgi:hypothetical protein